MLRSLTAQLQDRDDRLRALERMKAGEGAGDEKELVQLPDWRITCFFTGKGLRKRGVADAALGGALELIADLGGGVVEGYPEETDDRQVSGSFLHTGPMATFEKHGFTRARPISPHRWVVTRTVGPRS